jgi:hypothetical protein
MNDILYIIIPYFNFLNWESNKFNLTNFLTRNNFPSNARIVLAEGYINNELPDYSSKVYKHLKFKLKNMFWAKENLINVAINNLPKDWQFAVWIDRDVVFHTDSWVNESIEKLKKSDVIQPWNKLFYLDEDNKIRYPDFPNLSIFYTKSSPDFYDRKGHSGMGWGINKNFYSKIGKIIDWQIVGGGDVTFAFCCGMQNKERLKETPSLQTEGMRNEILNYAKLFHNTSYDYVNATIFHYPHGVQENRQYKTRWDILHNNNFNPSEDIFYNEQGIIEFSEKWANKASDQIERFFTLRKEDELKVGNCAWKHK